MDDWVQDPQLVKRPRQEVGHLKRGSDPLALERSSVHGRVDDRDTRVKCQGSGYIKRLIAERQFVSLGFNTDFSLEMHAP